MVEGDGPTTQHLISLGFDHVFFTGGTEVGRKIMEAAAKTLTPVILELGARARSSSRRTRISTSRRAGSPG